MGGRDHSCERCGRGGMNDDGKCECGPAPDLTPQETAKKLGSFLDRHGLRNANSEGIETPYLAREAQADEDDRTAILSAIAYLSREPGIAYPSWEPEKRQKVWDPDSFARTGSPPSSFHPAPEPEKDEVRVDEWNGKKALRELEQIRDDLREPTTPEPEKARGDEACPRCESIDRGDGWYEPAQPEESQ